jgi:hypothetical protein
MTASHRFASVSGANFHPASRRIAPPLAALMLALAAMPAAQAADASALGRELTPLGAEKAGNKAGTIPAWTDEAQTAGAFTPGKVLRAEAWRHKGDKPLYSIDAASAAQHADQLSPGQQALLKQFPGFRMDVYPTRRSCSAPAFVNESTKKNVGVAQLGADGWSLKDAWVPGVPFPMPSSGIEVMWNQKLRYRGVGTYGAGATYLSPRKGQSEWIAPRWTQTYYWPWAAQGSRKLSESGNINTQTHFTYTEPVALVGQAAIITDYFDQPGTDAYYYFPGQRRVRRMPAYAYDAPQIGFENQYNMDDTQVIMGALDRFDWKLAGKKEILVPYNAFGAFDFKSPWQQVITPSGLNTDHRRYELHRVWVVEATVKAGLRHQSPKRTYYIDEDSWNAVFAEDYDAQGKLTKVREGYLIPVFEVGACDVSAFAQYNLLEGRVLFDFSPVGAGTDVEYAVKPTKPAMRSAFYTPDNLRAISER